MGKYRKSHYRWTVRRRSIDSSDRQQHSESPDETGADSWRERITTSYSVSVSDEEGGGVTQDSLEAALQEKNGARLDALLVCWIGCGSRCIFGVIDLCFNLFISEEEDPETWKVRQTTSGVVGTKRDALQESAGTVNRKRDRFGAKILKRSFD